MIILYLLCGSLLDIKYKQISKKYVLIGAVVSIILFILFLEQAWISSLSGLFVGIAIIMLAKISKGGIGEGDGYVIGIIGILLGGRLVMILFCESIVLAAFYSICKLIRNKMRNNTSFPFLPFMFISYIVDVHIMNVI